MIMGELYRYIFSIGVFLPRHLLILLDDYVKGSFNLKVKLFLDFLFDFKIFIMVIVV
jgi:hypothetical protein